MAQWIGTGEVKKVDFSKRKLTALSKEHFYQAELTESLDLQVNQLEEICLISKMVNLKELFLSWNNFSEFPPGIGELSRLEVLYLNQNRIGEIPNGVLPRLHRLQRLNLSTNLLSDLPSDITLCKSLMYVNLSSNRLKDLQAMVGLPRLKELCVDNNRLEELPAELFTGSDLTMFKATGNPLRMPPDEVCTGGLEDIRTYFSQLAAGLLAESLRRVKTMFLGSTMAGKSTLCRSLREGRAVAVGAADRTVGIDICEVEMEGVRFLLWDFAGHEEYYLTHHVFITPQAFVILAIDLARYSISDSASFKEKVSFWINNVLMRVPDSVVLLVGTHADECTDSEDVRKKKADIKIKVEKMLEERKENLECQRSHIMEKDDPTLFSQQLSRLYRLTNYTLKVLDLITIDCTKSEEIVRFQEHILKQVLNKELFPNIERTVPRSYQEVETSVQGLIKNKTFPQHGIVHLDDLQRHSPVFKKLDKEDQRNVLRYLHRIGVVMLYDEINVLKDRVFTKPCFLIALFKTVVRHDLVKCLNEIPRNLVQKVGCLVKHKNSWINELKGKATLPNVAICALVRRSLMQMDLAKDERFMKEIAGTKEKEGILLYLLRHFEICLPATLSSPLNPQAQEFDPNRKWIQSAGTHHKLERAYLFPGYQKDRGNVMKMWGENNMEDIRVRIYFIPEIPHGVFHRLIVRVCSSYSTHWVGADCCLVGYSTTLVLLKQGSENEDDYIEIRCRRPTSGEALKRSWDIILVVIERLNQVVEQWPGLCQNIYSLCREEGCSYDFEWRDWTDLRGHDVYDLVKEQKIICGNGHICRAELLFPKVPSDPSSSTANTQNIIHVAGNMTVHVGDNPLQP